MSRKVIDGAVLSGFALLFRIAVFALKRRSGA